MVKRIKDLEERLHQADQDRLNQARTLDQVVGRARTAEFRLTRRLKEVEEGRQACKRALSQAGTVAGAPLRNARHALKLAADHLPAPSATEWREHLRRVESHLLDAQHCLASLEKLSALADCRLLSLPVDMTSLASEVVEELTKDLHDRSVETHVETLPQCVGDPELLRLLLANLLRNALAFSNCRAGSVIRVGTRHDAQETIWFVQDNGVGFRREQRHLLFQPFRTLHSTHKGRGLGLGLAQVRQIATRHGGRVWAEGEENVGSRFFFALRIKAAACDQRRTLTEPISPGPPISARSLP